MNRVYAPPSCPKISFQSRLRHPRLSHPPDYSRLRLKIQTSTMIGLFKILRTVRAGTENESRTEDRRAGMSRVGDRTDQVRNREKPHALCCDCDPSPSQISSLINTHLVPLYISNSDLQDCGSCIIVYSYISYGRNDMARGHCQAIAPFMSLPPKMAFLVSQKMKSLYQGQQVP